MSFLDYISSIWENLWFLRPQWFWVFLPIAMIGLFLLLNRRYQHAWRKQFPKHLLSVLTIAGTHRQFYMPKLLLLLLLSIMTIGMTGPTWEKIEQPGNRTEAALVVALDISRSMNAEDIPPNRLERAKLKLNDLFMAQPGVRISLVAFAGSAHVVVPFTKDYRTINRQLTALRPGIMPLQGSNISEALTLADTLLAKIEAPSTILLVTDNIENEDLQEISGISANTQIEIMLISTPTGGVVSGSRGPLKDKEGNNVVSRLDLTTIAALGQFEQVGIVPVTLDDSDVKILAAHLKQNMEFIADPKQAEEQWIDNGYWMMFPLVFFALFWFRRGWMVHWSLLILGLSSCAGTYNWDLKRLFFTPDQKGKILYDQGNLTKAAEQFTNPGWKGLVYSELGDLEAAAEAFSQDVTASGFYNLGLTYAKMGDLEAAQEAFNTAIELDPTLEVAEVNLKLLISHSTDTVNNNLTDGQLSGEENQAKEFQESMEFPDEKDKALDSDQTYQGKGDVVDMVTNEVDENQIDVFEFDQTAVISQEEAKQTLLRQVTEDPALFLRRKFAYQNRSRKDLKANQNPW